MIALSWAQFTRAQDESPNGSPRIFGIMVTRSDYWVMHTWLATHAWEFEKLVILDGTSESHSQFVEAAASMYDNVIYANEKDVEMPERITDNSLRGVAWSLLPNHEDMIGSWVVVAHPDEFFIVPFAELAAKADAEDYNAILFVTLYALPYSQDKQHLEDGISAGSSHFDILDSVRYCQSDYSWLEHRMHKYDSPHQRWGDTHALTRPQHFPHVKEAPWRGWYIHYKLHNFDSDALSSDGTFVHSRWATLGHSDRYEELDEHPSVLCSNMVHDLCNWPPEEPTVPFDLVYEFSHHPGFETSTDVSMWMGPCSNCRAELGTFCSIAQHAADRIESI